MNEDFIQKRIELGQTDSSGKIKVDILCNLISNHPYKEEVYTKFDVKNIKNEYIVIDNINTVANYIGALNKSRKRYKILAETKDVSIIEEQKVKNDKTERNIYFKFDEYIINNDEVESDLTAKAIYNAKNTFFEEYKMSKYANNLLEKGMYELVDYNVNHFKNLAKKNKRNNKLKSYRLLSYRGKTFLRGITSTNYHEYGVDFAFVVGMLMLHDNIKRNKGTSYEIKSVLLNESKLDIIIAEKLLRDAGEFGKVASAIQITTNDLGDGALNFKNIINVLKGTKNKGFYLFPKNDYNTYISINHNTKPINVFKTLTENQQILNTGEQFIEELNNVKRIKTPDELRVKILSKITNNRSSLKTIVKLSDIFKRKIDNEISNFSKLLEMCNKAEELDIEHDLKDKLRYIISDIILYGNVQTKK